MGSTLDVAGNTSIGGTFMATGNATFDGDVSVSGDINVGATRNYSWCCKFRKYFRYCR